MIWDLVLVWFGPVHQLSHFIAQAEDMINEIRSAFKEALDQLSWMDKHTRQAAKDKVGGTPTKLERQTHGVKRCCLVDCC